jgi:EAL domain-containing protein (putative c-di-GMP-specific phosphodiesterase class I)
MLKWPPVTAMKLDRSLVQGLPTSRKDAAIVRTAIKAGGLAMRLTTVAIGIETEAQRAFLLGIGCQKGQGDLFSYPLPAGQLRPTLGAARF